MAVLTIATLTLQAEGLGHLSGRVVFVPGALPGETVEIELTEEKKNYSRGRLVRILDPSPERVAPPCPHFERCGGCQVQHLPAEAQDRCKVENFRTAMVHALKQPDLPLLPLLEAPQRFHYRQRLRLKLGGPGRPVLGFYQLRSHRIIPIDRCLLADPQINDILDFLRPWLAGRPPFPEPADLEIRLLGENRGATLLISGWLSLSTAQKIRMARDLKKKKEIETVFFQDRSEGPLTGSDLFSPERHAALYRVPLGPAWPQQEISLAVFPQVFSQVNLFQNRRLIALLRGLPLLTSQDRIWDLFCGQGNFSIPLSFGTAAVTGVESFAPAVENAIWNQQINSGSRCRFIRATAREGLSRLIRSGERPDWVLLDPPRSGAGTIIPVLAELRAKGIFYVSCEPMTLFRDLSLLLRAGWRLEWTQPLDFFPQTYHLESLSLLRR
ncbi:MAG: class I SAM-dependent RNA methyltransferase [Deltaproteobacteria bacterium]|nr:class I SAM-dependent RNA methyltransferase [Deltaproteobacteria bacterium]